MTDIYLHFLFAHYGLYGNAPVRPVDLAQAYGELIALKNGSQLVAKRRQRPQLAFAPGAAVSARSSSSGGGDGGEWPKRVVTHLSTSLDLVFGENADGWGDSMALLLPLKQIPAMV